MLTNYTITYDETNQILHAFGSSEYLKVRLNPFSMERFDMNYPEKGFEVCLPDDLNFRRIHLTLKNAKKRFQYTDNIIQIFHPTNNEFDTTPEIKEQQERASLFHLWRFAKEINYKWLFQVIQFREAHTKLLYVFDRCQEMYDLAVSNPGLMYYLIAKHEFSPERIEGTIKSLKHLSRMKQKTIALSLGLKPQILNILKRIHPRALDKQDLIRFVDYLNRRDYPKYIHHLSRINLSHMKILCEENLQNHVTPIFMNDLSHLSQETHELDTADFLRQFIQNSKRYNVKIPSKFDSLRQIMKIWSVYPYLFGYDSDELEFQFPEPPIPPEPHIIPIQNPFDMIKEGQEMGNCLSDLSYIEAIKNGAYFYKILNRYGIRDRATLLINPVQDKDLQKRIYVIGEIQGKSNSPVRTATIRAIEDWLSISQGIAENECDCL